MIKSLYERKPIALKFLGAPDPRFDPSSLVRGIFVKRGRAGLEALARAARGVMVVADEPDHKRHGPTAGRRSGSGASTHPRRAQRGRR